MELGRVYYEVRADELARDYRRVRGGIMQELERFKFVYLPTPNSEFFERSDLLGVPSHERFPEVEQDAREAGNCLAFGLYTACVFHLMRIAEFGLRSLAKRVKVKPMHKKMQMPVEEAEWHQIITAVKGKLTTIQATPRGTKRRRSKLEGWSDAADHCTFMKDLWRNNVSHNRKPYTEAEALAALRRVRDFMDFLAKNIL